MVCLNVLDNNKHRDNNNIENNQMQVIQIKPSNFLSFKVPHNLTTKFIIGNLTIRSTCIYIIPLHPQAISIDKKAVIIDPFQECEITLSLHWSQEISCRWRTKIRVYIWQLYEQENLNDVVVAMFGKQMDGNCLLFEELSIDVEVDSKYLQSIHYILPSAYCLSRLQLPNHASVELKEGMIDKVISFCQKMGKVKAIYTYGEKYVIEFSQLDEVVGAFYQVRDQGEQLAIFGISCVPSLGNIVFTPDLLILSPSVEANLKIFKSVGHKQLMSSKQLTGSKQTMNRQLMASVATCVESISTKQVKQNKQEVQGEEQVKNSYKSILKQERQKSRPKNRDLVKQSFVSERSVKSTKKRTKSQQYINEIDDENESSQIDMNSIHEWKAARNYEANARQFQQKTIDVSKKILNMAISSDQKHLYVLVQNCVMVFQTQNPSSKKILKFDPIDSENLNLPTPMLIFNKDKTIIFANESYLFWVSLSGEQEADWKYVQRKQIYCIEVVDELNLLMVGGKNFSKLSYLGKSTSRSNIKVYSCGKVGKREHLFTYDIPDCHGQNVMEMKYIATKPNGTKLLLVLTSHNRIFFLRVRAFDHFEVYSCTDVNEIGIQEIVSLNYHIGSSILICLEKLSEDLSCFKYIKVLCSYEKVEISTESVKVPVVKYQNRFRVGGKEGNEWLTAVDSNNCIYSLYLEWKQPQKGDYGSAMKDCILIKNGAIFRGNTDIRFRILKQ